MRDKWKEAFSGKNNSMLLLTIIFKYARVTNSMLNGKLPIAW